MTVPFRLWMDWTHVNTDDSGLIYSFIYINDSKSVTLCEVLLFSEYVIDFIVLIKMIELVIVSVCHNKLEN